jgi:hypothetical protein
VIRGLAIGALLLLAACNRQGAADVTLDADAAQRNATAAKTLADLAAADAASRGPAPVVRDVPPAKSAADTNRQPAEPVIDDSVGEAPTQDDQSVAIANES